MVQSDLLDSVPVHHFTFSRGTTKRGNESKLRRDSSTIDEIQLPTTLKLDCRLNIKDCILKLNEADAPLGLSRRRLASATATIQAADNFDHSQASWPLIAVCYLVRTSRTSLPSSHHRQLQSTASTTRQIPRRIFAATKRLFPRALCHLLSIPSASPCRFNIGILADLRLPTTVSSSPCIAASCALFCSSCTPSLPVSSLNAIPTRRHAPVHFPRWRRPVAGPEDKAEHGRSEATPANRTEQPVARGSRTRAHPREPGSQEVCCYHVSVSISAVNTMLTYIASLHTATARVTTWSPPSGAPSPRARTRTHHNRAADAVL